MKLAQPSRPTPPLTLENTVAFGQHPGGYAVLRSMYLRRFGPLPIKCPFRR